MVCSLKTIGSICTIKISLWYQKPFWSHFTIIKPGNGLKVIRCVIWVLKLERCTKLLPSKFGALLDYLKFGSFYFRKLFWISLASLMKPWIVRSFKSMHCVNRMRWIVPIIDNVIHGIPKFVVHWLPLHKQHRVNNHLYPYNPFNQANILLCYNCKKVTRL
jgi:hypothetical protein